MGQEGEGEGERGQKGEQGRWEACWYIVNFKVMVNKYLHITRLLRTKKIKLNLF